jgi:hypothetical protein
MGCRTLGGLQACLCGTSGCSAKLLCQGREAGSVTSRLSWFQGRGPSRWRLPRSHISYPREKFSTPIMRSIIPLGLCAITPADSSRPCYITVPRRFPLHPAECYFVSNTPAPFKPRASAQNHRRIRARADRGKALAHPSLF